MKKSSILLCMFMCLNLSINFAQATKPYQFIAKLYTESMGVIPDPTAYKNLQDEMDSAPDLKQWMKNKGHEFFTNQTYFLDKYPIDSESNNCKAARLLALYRGAYNREPELDDFNIYLSQITNETTWANLVTQFFNSTESNALLDNAIYRANQGKPYYGWGYSSVSNVAPIYPVVGFPSESRIVYRYELQTLLNSAQNSSNKVVLLSQMAVVFLDDSLIIPSGVTLATIGYPTRTEYARMARIVWDPNVRNTNHMIWMDSGSKLLSVWVDGQAGTIYPRFPKDESSTIWVQGDRTYQNVEITDNRISDSFGVRCIWMGGHLSHLVGCRNNKISSNLFTGYANDHFTDYTDGIDFGSEDTDVCYNEFVDITDVAIGIFRSQPSGNNSFGVVGSQHSKIHDNKILNAGNSSTGSIAIDPGSTLYADGNTEFNFYGTKIYNNTIWTSNSAHIDVALQIGCRWMYQSNPVKSKGGYIYNNTLGSNTSTGNIINTNIAILIDGAIQDSVQNNSINSHIEAYHSRPTGVRLKNSDSNWAGESFCSSCYETYETAILNCWGHTGGAYINGVNETSFNVTQTFTAVEMGDYQISSYSWQLTDYNNINNVRASFTGNPISVNFSNYYPQGTQKFRLRLNVGPINGQWTNDAWKEKYIKNSSLSKRSSEMDGPVPLDYELKQNYPNPFNPITTINYSLKENGLVQLAIYNILGQRIIELVNSVQEAGIHNVTFDGSNLSSGIYFYRFQSNGFFDSKKLILMK